jgi:hypothetical protein
VFATTWPVTEAPLWSVIARADRASPVTCARFRSVSGAALQTEPVCASTPTLVELVPELTIGEKLPSGATTVTRSASARLLAAPSATASNGTATGSVSRSSTSLVTTRCATAAI